MVRARQAPAAARTETHISRLRDLPNLNAVPHENWNQDAVALCVVSDIGGARHTFDQIRPLAVLIAIHRGVGPARHPDRALRDLDAVKLPRPFSNRCDARLTWFPRPERAGPERHDDEPLIRVIPNDSIGAAECVVLQCNTHLSIGRYPEHLIAPDV